jgi:hypothetical protein
MTIAATSNAAHQTARAPKPPRQAARTKFDEPAQAIEFEKPTPRSPFRSTATTSSCDPTSTPTQFRFFIITCSWYTGLGLPDPAHSPTDLVVNGRAGHLQKSGSILYTLDALDGNRQNQKAAGPK